MLQAIRPRLPDDDNGLASAASAGVAGAFEALVERHYRRIYRYLLKHAISPAEAEELTQEVFLQAHLGLERFRGESRFSTWLTGIALNLVRNFTNRSPWRLSEIGTDDLPEGVDPQPEAEGLMNGSPEEQFAFQAALNALADAIGGLTAEARESLMLVAMEGLSYDEVAAMLGEPQGSIKSRVSRARQQLRQTLDPSHLEALSGRI